MNTFYEYFIYYFPVVVSVFAGYGLSRFYIGHQLLSSARPGDEPLSGQVQRQMRIGMSMFLTVLLLLVLFSIVGIISHKLAEVIVVLIASAFGTLLSVVLFTVISRDI